jgi:hypothetical protein
MGDNIKIDPKEISSEGVWIDLLHDGQVQAVVKTVLNFQVP